MNLTRRGFIQAFSAIPAAVIAPKASAIWLPETQLDVEVPKEIKVVQNAIWSGGHIGVRVVQANLFGLALDTVMNSCPDYYLAGTPMLIVRSPELNSGWYIFAGDKGALKEGYKAKILLAWEVGQNLVRLEE